MTAAGAYSEVLMFDEPANGLDPEGVLWVRTLVKSLAAEGRTVLLSSHLMSEMAITADRLIIIGRGRLVAQTSVADLYKGGSGGFVRVHSPDVVTLAVLLEAQGISVQQQSHDTIRIFETSSDVSPPRAALDGIPEHLDDRDMAHVDAVRLSLAGLHLSQVAFGVLGALATLWDVRDRRGTYTITVTADAFCRSTRSRRTTIPQSRAS